MSAKLVLHLPDHERALLEAGKMSSLYPRIKKMVEARGGVVEIAPRFARLRRTAISTSSTMRASRTRMRMF